MTSLEITNSHERDKNIEFIEEGHVYNINQQPHSFIDCFLILMKIKLLII